jgi:hypothetical protein
VAISACRHSLTADEFDFALMIGAGATFHTNPRATGAQAIPTRIASRLTRRGRRIARFRAKEAVGCGAKPSTNKAFFARLGAVVTKFGFVCDHNGLACESIRPTNRLATMALFAEETFRHVTIFASIDGASTEVGQQCVTEHTCITSITFQLAIGRATLHTGVAIARKGTAMIGFTSQRNGRTGVL